MSRQFAGGINGARLVPVGKGLDRLGKDWSGSVRLGMARLGKVRIIK